MELDLNFMDLTGWIEACQTAFDFNVDDVEYWEHPSAYFGSVSVESGQNETGDFNAFVFSPRGNDPLSDVAKIAPLKCSIYPSPDGLAVDYGTHKLLLNICEQDLPTLDLPRVGNKYQIQLKMPRASKAALRKAIDETEKKYGLDSSIVYQAVTFCLQCLKASQFTSQKWCVAETTPK